MTRDEKNKANIDTSITYRGKILHNISLLEIMLNMYIAIHFCGRDNEKINDMQLLVLGDERMSLGNKAQVFHFIATHYDKVWYGSYNSFRPKQDKKPKYTLNQDLVYAIEERNVFAHRLLDTDEFLPESLPDGTLRFVRFKNSIEAIDYNEDKFNELSNMIIKMCYFLGKRINA